jgi:hypothetical protein
MENLSMWWMWHKIVTLWKLSSSWSAFEDMVRDVLKENLPPVLKLECHWNNLKKNQYMALDFWYMCEKLYTNWNVCVLILSTIKSQLWKKKKLKKNKM